MLPKGTSLTRSLGVVEEDDFVVEITGEGKLLLREEPMGRRLGRGEVLPNLELDVFQLWNQRGAEAPKSDSWLDEMIAAIPVADFSGPPEKVGYLVKVWVLNYLKTKNENKSVT